MALPHSFWNNPAAYMGFVGFVRLKQTEGIKGSEGVSDITHGDFLIRATSADINVSQEISKPDVVDSRYDRSVYQLGPRLVDGSVSFPVLYEVPTGEEYTLFELLYRYAATRDRAGQISPFDLEVKYASGYEDPTQSPELTYRGCIVNTWQFSVAQSDVITCSFDIIGIDRQEPAATSALESPKHSDDELCEGSTSTATDSLGVTRIITWNDARVEIGGPRFVDTSGTGLGGSIGGQYVRTFEANINNDAERFYTLNTFLFAQAIAPRKRDVTGSMTILGRHIQLSQIARENEQNCTESSFVKFGYSTPATGEGCDPSTFAVQLPNCIFEIETMSLSNDLFESTINWHSLPSAGVGVCDPLLTTLGADVKFLYEEDATSDFAV